MIEIKIETKNNQRIIRFLHHQNIKIYNTKYEKEHLIITINKKDLSKIKNIYKYQIKKYYGIDSIKNYLKKNILSILYLLSIIITIIVLTRIIIEVNIITENQSIHSILLNELDKHKIKKYSLVKTEQTLTSIKESILNNNKDLLEWINIERIGMTYEINIEPRIIKNKNIQKEYCNIISTKDATISKITTYKGNEKVSINDSVKKGDLLISGDITYNEELKKQVCASGVVYGKTWYTINIKIPLEKEYIKKSPNNRYNLLIETNNHKQKIFKPRLNNYIEENKKLLSIFGTTIYLQKEIKITKEIKKYTEEEITKLIEEKISKTMSNTLNSNSQIIDRKVLKKQVKNSTIELDIFIVAEEQISSTDN